MRLSSSHWFDCALTFVIGLFLGLLATPFLWGTASTAEQFYLGILGNILAAFIVLPAFLVLNILEARCSQIRKFFGIRSNGSFYIFVGHLNYPGLGAGVAGVEELNEAHRLRSSLQNFVPGLGDAYFLRRLKLADVEVEVIIANNQHDYVQYRHTSFITIGSGGSNGVSRMIEEQLPARVDFAQHRIRIGNNREENSAGRGLIVCKRDGLGNVWFYIAGQTEPDTAGSARFIRENWSLVSRKYPKTDFYYLLDTSHIGLRSLPTVIEDSAFR